MLDARAVCDEIIAAKGREPEPERLRRLIDAGWQWSMEIQPESATLTGEPGHDDRWMDASREGIEREKQGALAFAEAARSIDPSRLAPADALDHELFLGIAERQEDATRFPSELQPIGPMGGPQSFVPMLLGMMRTDSDEARAAIVARVRAIPTLIEQITELMREGLGARVTPPRVVLEPLVEQLRAHTAPDNHPVLAALQQPGTEPIRDEVAEAVRAQVVPAFGALLEFFASEYLPGCRDSIAMSELPDGEEWYAHNVRDYTTTDLSPKEIHETGLAEVERIRAEMDSVIQRCDFDGSFVEFTTFLRTDPRFYFSSPEELLGSYRDICKRADPELIRMFGTLPRTPYGVKPVPPHEEERQTTAYYLPGSPEAGRPGYFYANTYDLASRPSWEMEALTLHEAVPGHHLQIALAQEMGEVPKFRKHARFTAFIEGWGLYAESLGEEMGFYTDPYAKFGQLTYEMWRAIRLVVDTGMHAFGWSRERAIEFFTVNTGKAPHDIEVEVDRYIGWPGQALAYKIGELTLKRLRARATERLGAGFDIRAFHDALLESGALPLDVLERRIDAWIEARAQAVSGQTSAP